MNKNQQRQQINRQQTQKKSKSEVCLTKAKKMGEKSGIACQYKNS